MKLPFVSLGIRQNTAKLVGELNSARFFKHAEIVSMKRDQTEAILSLGRFEQLSIINNRDGALLKSWAFRKDVVVAQSEGSSLVSAPQGTYRIDIGYGSSFVCDPLKLVGLLGTTKIETIYTESRLDVAKSWASMVWGSTKELSRRSAQRISQLFRKIPWPQRIRQASLPKLSIPELPAAWKNNLQLASQKWRQFSAYIATSLYYKTHPRKIKIEGPGSVLLRT